MDERLKQLVVQVQQYSQETQEHQNALRELVEQILRSRSICRPSKGQPLSATSLGILQAVRQQLQQDVDQTITRYNLERTSVKDWANGLCNSAFQKVLDDSRLTQLALEAQQHKPQSQQRQYALQELLTAIRLSGRLSHKGRASGEAYDDAVTRTLLWVCQNLKTYNPSKGKFIAWVNYRLDMILREIQQEYKDPFIQSIEGKIIRRKYQLNALIKKTKKADLIDWLTLYLKKIIPNQYFSLTVISLLIVLLLLSQLIIQNPGLADSLLFDISKESLPLSSRFHDLTAESKTLENLPQPEVKPFLSDMVRQYIEDDPAKLFQKHIREHPQATFQAIALARMEGKPWKELSESWGIGIPALNNFFQRRLKEFAPEIRKFIQD